MTLLAELESRSVNNSTFSDIMLSLIAQFTMNCVLLAVKVYVIDEPQSKSEGSLGGSR